MNNVVPDFYMTSSEDSRLRQLRKCYIVKRFPSPDRDDYLLIRIFPALDGEIFGVAGGEIEQLIIATRHKGISLFPVQKWPVAVYVLRVLTKNIEETRTITDDEIALLGWAEIYDSQLNIY